MSSRVPLSGVRDRVLFESADHGQRFRIAFIGGEPKLELQIRGDWYIAALKGDGSLLLDLYVDEFAHNLRTQLGRAEAEVRLARNERDEPRALTWTQTFRRLANEIDALPYPWNRRGGK